jgi:hypothetical protein
LTVEKIITQKSIMLEPVFESDVTDINNVILRLPLIKEVNHKIEIGYSSQASGQAQSEVLPYTVQVIGGAQQTIGITHFIPGVSSSAGLHTPLSGINQADYLPLVKDSNNGPEDIANKFFPKFNVKESRNGSPINKTVAELRGQGFGAVNFNSPKIEIKDTLSLTYPNVEIDVKDTRYNYQNSASTYKIPVYSFPFTYKVIYLAAIIAHELGHILFGVNNRLAAIGWSILEDEYIEDITGSSNPVFTGDGHLEGNPSGNLAGFHEMIFAQRFVEQELWGIAEESIRSNTTIGNPEEIIASKKVESLSLLPYYLEADPAIGSISGDPDYYTKHTFRIRTYLKGNLSEEDHSGIIPKL